MTSKAILDTEKEVALHRLRSPIRIGDRVRVVVASNSYEKYGQFVGDSIEGVVAICSENDLYVRFCACARWVFADEEKAVRVAGASCPS